MRWWMIKNHPCGRQGAVYHAELITWRYTGPGAWFNIKMSSYPYRKSHCGNKTFLRPSHRHNRISYTGKMTSLYWDGPQGISSHCMDLLLLEYSGFSTKIVRNAHSIHKYIYLYVCVWPGFGCPPSAHMVLTDKTKHVSLIHSYALMISNKISQRGTIFQNGQQDLRRCGHTLWVNF